MSYFPTRWNALAVVLALATMVGCQGLSTSKSDVQTPPNPLPGTLSAAPASVSFGNVQVGTSQNQSNTVSNTGGATVTVTKADVTGAGFSITGLTLPFTLSPAVGKTFSVVFAPQSVGSVSGTLVFTNSDSSTFSVPLSGTAVGAGSTATLSVSPVSAGSVVVGTAGTQTGTLTAAGASVSVTSVSLGGTNPSEFSISGLSFPVTVTTSQPVTFTVTFTPGASGAASASASFASTATNSPSAAALTGTGTAAPVHSVSLSWTASTTTGVTSYNVYRAVFGTSCGSYSNVGSTPSSTTTFTDSVVADGTTYCYATTAVDPSGESAYSNISKAVIPAP
jgi:Abnormal spindle-like microcephaly-assoc'd, ASPM-SPD-2-Hydin